MTYDVREQGARGDGVTLDHTAIQAAIDRCSAGGGGTVLVPAGRYRCGTIHLKSHVQLYLDNGARIEGADDASLYPVIAPTPHGNLPGQIQALLWIEAAENASVAGSGVIDGGGHETLSGKAAAGRRFRPALVVCRDCRDLHFSEVTLSNSCYWTLHLQRCTDVSVRGVKILANMGRINTDGIDPDGCRNVVISDCIIRTGDDCIVIKSTEGDPCENITVSNCILSSSCAALKLGTESLGPIRNVTFNNCQITDTNVALALYMKDGSCFENVLFSNIIAEVRGEFPIIVDITPRYFDAPKVGSIRNVLFQDVIVRGRGRCYVEGSSERPVENLSFTNMRWDVTGALEKDAAKPTGAARVRLDPARENHAAHPHQFIVLNAAGLRMRDVVVSSAGDGAERGLLFMRNVKGAQLGISGRGAIAGVVSEACEDVRVGE